MPYNTGNPIPSSDAKDLSDNAENLDNSVNTALDTWTDRLGVVRRTIQGQLKLLGYTAPDVYAGGLVFTIADNMATIDRNGTIYAPKPSAIPFTTSGTWTADDENKFFVVQGATLDDVVISANTVADMKTKDLQPGQFIRTKGYHTNEDSGGATYLIQTAAEYGGTPDGFGDHTLDNGNIAAIQVTGSTSLKQYGCKFDGSDDTAAFQAAIDARDDLYIPAGTVTVDGIEINKAIKITGATHGTSTIKSIGSKTTGNIVSVANNVFTSGCILADFEVEGNNDNSTSDVDSIVGLSFGTSVSIAATRNSFTNIYIKNVNIGWLGTYAWTNTYRNLSAAGCAVAFRGATQVNNADFVKFIALNCKTALDINNCEGMQFISPLFQNSTLTAGQGQGVTLFQSNVIMSNPYFENFSQDGLASVGSPAEDITSPSSLEIVGGESNTANSNILVTSSYASVRVTNLRTPSGQPDVVIGAECAFDGTSTVGRAGLKPNSFLSRLNAANESSQLFYDLPVNNKFEAAKIGGGGGVLTLKPTNKGTTEAAVDVSFRGMSLLPSDVTLKANTLYTLVYCINSEPDNSLKLRLDRDISMPRGEIGSSEIIYLPVLIGGTDTTAGMLFSKINSDVEIKKFSVYEGCYIQPSNIPVNTEVYNQAPPTTGFWLRNQVVFNRSAAVGQPAGWTCVGTGTPGTWAAMANLT